MWLSPWPSTRRSRGRSALRLRARRAATWTSIIRISTPPCVDPARRRGHARLDLSWVLEKMAYVVGEQGALIQIVGDRSRARSPTWTAHGLARPDAPARRALRRGSEPTASELVDRGVPEFEGRARPLRGAGTSSGSGRSGLAVAGRADLVDVAEPHREAGPARDGPATIAASTAPRFAAGMDEHGRPDLWARSGGWHSRRRRPDAGTWRTCRPRRSS